MISFSKQKTEPDFSKEVSAPTSEITTFAMGH